MDFSHLAFISLHLCATKQLSSAKSRSSNLSLIHHYVPLFLPYMTLFMKFATAQCSLDMKFLDTKFSYVRSWIFELAPKPP